MHRLQQSVLVLLCFALVAGVVEGHETNFDEQEIDANVHAERIEEALNALWRKHGPALYDHNLLADRIERSARSAAKLVERLRELAIDTVHIDGDDRIHHPASGDTCASLTGNSCRRHTGFSVGSGTPLPSPEAPRIRVISPSLLSIVSIDDVVELEVSGIELGQTEGPVILYGNHGQALPSNVLHETKATIRTLLGSSAAISVEHQQPFVVGFEFMIAHSDAEPFLTAGSIATTTLWFVPSYNRSRTAWDPSSVYTPTWGIDDIAFHKAMSTPSLPPPQRDEPSVSAIHMVYPSATGLDVMDRKGLTFCYTLVIPSSSVWMTIIVNPTPGELRGIKGIFALTSNKNHHDTREDLHCLHLETTWFIHRLVDGVNSFHVWVSGRQTEIQAHATATFTLATSTRLASLAKAFATERYLDFIRPNNAIPVVGANGDGVERAHSSDLDGVAAHVRSSGLSNTSDPTNSSVVLIVAEVPPKPKGATGDEHAVSVVVDAVRGLGLDFVLVTRICSWTEPTRGLEYERADMANMDPYIKSRLRCPVNVRNARPNVSDLRSAGVVVSSTIVMSRVWDVPYVDGLPHLWIPAVKHYFPDAVSLVWGVDVHAACDVSEHYTREGKGTYIRQMNQLSSLGFANAVIGYTPQDIEYLESVLPPEAKLFSCPTNHGKSMSGDETVPPFEERDGVMLLGFSHIINIESNLFFLARVWPTVSAAVPSARVRVVGMTKKEAAKYATKLGYNMDTLDTGNVEWLGYVPDLDQILNKTLVMATPILSCPEFCSKNLRGLEAGVPVVTSLRGGQGFMLDDLDGGQGITSVPVSWGEFEQFSNSVINLMTDPQAWSQSSRGGMRHIASRFQRRHVVRDLQIALTSVGQGQGVLPAQP